MKAVVCVRQGIGGEISPFDASAYESALSLGLDITLLSMASPSAEDFLSALTRLGANDAILLSDKAFSGADTLATAYALSRAIDMLSPSLVFCGRQTLIGDTGQTGIMLAEMLGYSLVTEVMEIKSLDENTVVCRTRKSDEVRASLPALLTVERINTLRLPRLRSRIKPCRILSAADIGADTSRCGLTGSPTRVISTSEHRSGRRKCKFTDKSFLADIIASALSASKHSDVSEGVENTFLDKVFTVGEAPLPYAEKVCKAPTVIPPCDAATLADIIEKEKPDAVLLGSDSESKALAACVAARLSLGLCADCTSLEAKDDELLMIRPALSGSIIAKIRSLTRPALATVRTTRGGGRIVLALGMGAVSSIEKMKAFASDIGAEICASRRLVDEGILPYHMQVGLTGKSVSPDVYIAVGISGAVHHIVGMERSGTVIAVNPDKNAPIFDYADYGILCSAEEL